MNLSEVWSHACNYLIEHGVVMLRDSNVTIADGLTLVGREDRSISQFLESDRKEIKRFVDRT